MTSGSVHKHKDKKEKKKKTKRKKKSNKSSHVGDTEMNYGGSGDEMTDLDEELHPIGYYINDREEMINQMFSVIKPDKLRAMLPPILKESTVEKLKAYCLDELLGMSWKRINSVLEGRELETSSESDDESIVIENVRKSESSSPADSDTQWPSDEEKTAVPEVAFEEAYAVEDTSAPANDMDMLEIGITSEEMGELLNCMPSEKTERKRQVQQQEPSTSCSKKRKWKLKRPKFTENVKQATKKNIGDDKSDSSVKNSDDEKNESATEDNTDESKGKTLLEILELEMRARAIRALLKQQIGTGEVDDTSGSSAPSEKDTSEPPTTIFEDVKENPKSNSVSHSQKSQDCDSGMNNTSSSDAKQIRKKLKRDTIKPADASLQCVSNTASVNVVLETDFSDSLPKSESKNEDYIKETETRCSLNVIVKTEIPNDEQTVPDLENSSKNEENEIIVSKRGSGKRNSFREDGELSSDGEKSSDSILEIQPEGGSSDVIILDDSEDELMDFGKNPSPPEKQGTSSSNADSIQAKTTETENIMEIKVSESQKHGSSSSRQTEDKISSGKVSKNETVHYDINDSPSNLDKKSPKEMVDSADFEDINPEVGDDRKGKSSENPRKNEAVDVSWAARWLQSKGVQKVVSTSKMCAKIRNRMKSAQKVKKINAKAPQQEETKKQSVVIVGSVNEYNMLDKPKSTQKGNCAESDEKNADAVGVSPQQKT